MAYVDYDYYTGTFGGDPVPEAEFPALARQASDLIDMLATATPDPKNDLVKQAACYQVELLYQAGGVTGMAASESLGSYSVSNDLSRFCAAGGVPVSPLCLSKLEAVGLLGRWI